MRRILAVVLLGGCADGAKDDGDGDGDGDEALAGCLVDATEAIADTSATPEGFGASVDAMLARVLGDFQGIVERADGAERVIRLGLVQDGDPEVERRSWQDDGDDGGIEPAIGVDCSDDVRVPATVTLQVGRIDGDVLVDLELDETIVGDVLVDTAGVGSFGAGIAFDALHGSATPFGFDPADMAETTFFVSASIPGDDWTGELSFQGESPPSGTGDDATVSATNDPWGTFDAVPMP